MLKNCNWFAIACFMALCVGLTAAYKNRQIDSQSRQIAQFHNLQTPSRAVVAAMENGHNCWLEISYTLHAGNLNADSSEWLCK